LLVVLVKIENTGRKADGGKPRKKIIYAGTYKKFGATVFFFLPFSSFFEKDADIAYVISKIKLVQDNKSVNLTPPF
jgi:hypothetical protein